MKHSLSRICSYNQPKLWHAIEFINCVLKIDLHMITSKLYPISSTQHYDTSKDDMMTKKRERYDTYMPSYSPVAVHGKVNRPSFLSSRSNPIGVQSSSKIFYLSVITIIIYIHHIRKEKEKEFNKGLLPIKHFLHDWIDLIIYISILRPRLWRKDVIFRTR